MVITARKFCKKGPQIIQLEKMVNIARKFCKKDTSKGPQIIQKTSQYPCIIVKYLTDYICLFVSKGGIKEKDILHAIYKYASPKKTEVVLHIK